MARSCLGHGLPKCPLMERDAQAVRKDVVEDRRLEIQRSVEEHPGLQTAQGIRVFGGVGNASAVRVRDQRERRRLANRCVVVGGARRRDERSNRPPVIEVPDAEHHAADPRSRDHTQRQDGIAAELEVVVVDPDARHPKSFGPDLAERTFAVRARRGEHGPRGTLGLRKRMHVQLAVRSERSCVDSQHMGRHHIVRQRPLEDGSERRHLEARIPCDHIRHELPDAGARPYDDDGVVDAALGAKGRLDLTGLDSETPNLDLRVGAAEILDVADFGPASQIAAPVQPRPRARRERIRHESLGRQRRPAQVAAAHARAADVDLAAHAHGRRFERLIEHIEAQVRNLRADHASGARRHVGETHQPICHVDGRLRDAVHVHETRRVFAVRAEPRLEGGQIERLAAKNHVSQRERTRRLGCPPARAHGRRTASGSTP